MVVDASVAAKWVLHEPGREHSLRILDAYEAAEVALLAPSLLPIEVGSVLTKRQRRNQLSPGQVREAFRMFEIRCPVLTDVREQMGSAMELAALHRLAIYDCLYLALALERGCALITADRKFYEATCQAYTSVRLLESITAV